MFLSSKERCRAELGTLVWPGERGLVMVRSEGPVCLGSEESDDSGCWGVGSHLEHVTERTFLLLLGVLSTSMWGTGRLCSPISVSSTPPPHPQ